MDKKHYIVRRSIPTQEEAERVINMYYKNGYKLHSMSAVPKKETRDGILLESASCLLVFELAEVKGEQND